MKKRRVVVGLIIVALTIFGGVSAKGAPLAGRAKKEAKARVAEVEAKADEAWEAAWEAKLVALGDRRHWSDSWEKLAEAYAAAAAAKEEWGAAAEAAGRKTQVGYAKADAANAREWAAEAKAKADEATRARIARDRRLAEEYDEEIVKLILAGEYSIGMTAEMVRDSIGLPDDINRTVTANGTNEQWVYGKEVYLYFDNDILTSWQD